MMIFPAPSSESDFTMATAPRTHLEAALQRTRKSYDDTPYVHAPMMRSHPGRLAAQAVWRGLAAPDAARARVLEIGCASGGNLLPHRRRHAATARFLGVDLSPVQIAAGEARRRRFRPGNVELRAELVRGARRRPTARSTSSSATASIPGFPSPCASSLMRVVRERLAPEGIAMVSFNVLPGWRLFQIAARFACAATAPHGQTPPGARRRRGICSPPLAAQSADKHTYGKFWRDEAQTMAAGGDAYLAHEIFEESNAPETFADFAARAGASASTISARPSSSPTTRPSGAARAPKPSAP